jgi:hypothetical protein
MTARSKGPMPAERVKDGWQGQSTEALMAKGDFLPLGVRECPRAFIVPARESTQRTKSKRYLAKEAQKFSHSSSLPSLSQPWQGHQQSLPPSPFGPAQPAQPAMWPIQPPPPPPPPAYPVAGHAAPMFWAPQPGVWTPQYPYGYQMPYAIQVPALLQQPSPFAYPAPPPPPSFPTVSSYNSFLPQYQHTDQICYRTRATATRSHRLPHCHQDLSLPQSTSNHQEGLPPLWTTSHHPKRNVLLASTASSQRTCLRKRLCLE